MCVSHFVGCLVFHSFRQNLIAVDVSEDCDVLASFARGLWELPRLVTVDGPDGFLLQIIDVDEDVMCLCLCLEVSFVTGVGFDFYDWFRWLCGS